MIWRILDIILPCIGSFIGIYTAHKIFGARREKALDKYTSYIYRTNKEMLNRIYKLEKKLEQKKQS